MGSRLAKLAYYLPPGILSNQSLSERFGKWSPARIESKLGIRERHVAAPDETALDMAYQAALQLLTPEACQQIDFLLFCTQSPDYYLPSSACILQDRLQLPKHIGALDFNLGCSGFIYGLALAKSLISSQVAHNVLLLTGETYTKYIHPQDQSNLTIFGDGAAAALVQACDQEMIGEFVLGTDGSGYDKLIVPTGGARKAWIPEAPLLDDGNGNHRTENNISMSGPDIFTFTIDEVPQTVANTLKKNKLKIEEIDYFILHQANQYILNYLREKMDIPAEKFYLDMLDCGNTVSSTIPIALHRALLDGRVKPHQKVLLCGFGVGLSWGACVIEIPEEK